ncbi:hypothetical protein BCV70DRAFT_93351 [Testicularia cyperi]|uniref:Uncharacterized protein n=1 Tax=Testicularia cyperi TaxID=1882483 RepID=A0A317XF56_9BASI|nr:hypothetical protein BCV70DRAFT_93351 [Testicularia cyperi]
MQTAKKTGQEAVDALSSPSNPAHWYAYASAAYLTLLSLPLVLFPRLLLILSTPRGAAGQAVHDGAKAGHDPVSAIGPELTPLERFGSYSNAISMLAVAAMVLILSGAIPVSTSPVPDSASAGKSPFRMPVVFITTLYFATNAFVAWNQAGGSTTSSSSASASVATPGSPSFDPRSIGIGSFGKVLGFGHALFAFWGFGVFMFGNDLTRNKKKTGNSSARDKSVSSFPFKNQYAAEEKSKKSS